MPPETGTIAASAVVGTLLMNMASVISIASSLRSFVFIEDFLPFELLAEVIGAAAFWGCQPVEITGEIITHFRQKVETFFAARAFVY